MVYVSMDSSLLKKLAIVLFAGVLVTVLYLLVRPKVDMASINAAAIKYWSQEKDSEKASVPGLEARFRQQRDDVSRQLNQMKKLYGQQSCNQLKLMKNANQNVDERVSENGGWCGKTSSSSSASHMMDPGFMKSLSKFLKGKTVGSFGDGPGDYKKNLDSLGEIKSYTAYDGAPYCENVTNNIVKFLDLTATQYGLPVFDWVVSVEVGEHIPAQFEDIYLDNLVRHAREGIILSWAVPGQPGLSHVNNKALDDVKAQMARRGFEIDVAAGEPLRKSSAYWWLQKNIHVYYRTSPDSLIEADA